MRFSILVEEYPRRNPKGEAGNLRRQDQRRKWQVLESRQYSMRDDMFSFVDDSKVMARDLVYKMTLPHFIRFARRQQESP